MSGGLELRHPDPSDGLAVHRLVVGTGVLDVNSSYAYVAHFRHFSTGSCVAVAGGEVVGFVMGYRLLERPDTYFLWQVGVSEAGRGKGLATRMIRFVLAAEPELRWLETTITPDNVPSRTLFSRLADKLGAGCDISPCFSTEQLGEGHAPEELFRIGPIPNLERNP